MKQIITINNRGEIATLEFKKGVDVKKLGKANVKRITDIVWNDECGLWQIQALQGTLAGNVLTFEQLKSTGIMSDVELLAVAERLSANHAECQFDAYEWAVQFEVMLIQTARRLGMENFFINADLI